MLEKIFSSIPRWRSYGYRGNTLAEEKDRTRFAFPQPNPCFHFPEDDASHPEFRIEWWYISAHLFAQSNERFGLQATFFRLLHGNYHYFMSHMAVSDEENQTFKFEERLSLEGSKVFAGSKSLNVRNGNWSLSRKENSEILELHGGVHSEIQFDLDLLPEKERVIFGEKGVTQRSPDSTVSSFYLTYPRLKVSGTWHSNGQASPVVGEAWMDHEIASRQLADDQVGWNWLQMQFFDGWELMTYTMRGDSDTAALVWITPEGSQLPLESNQFRWETGSQWESPRTGAKYPIRPTIRTIDPRNDEYVNLQFHPLLEDQEIRGKLDIIYWEGAGDVKNECGQLLGRSFLELTGYVGRLKEILR